MTLRQPSFEKGAKSSRFIKNLTDEQNLEVI